MIYNGFSQPINVGYDPSVSANISKILDRWNTSFEKAANYNLKTLRLYTKPAYHAEGRVYSSLVPELLNMSENYGYNVVLDLHNFGGDEGYFGSNQWVELWKMLAQRYASDSRIIAYELWNEPFVKKSWSTTIKDYPDIYKAYELCTNAVRQIDNSKTIIWGDPLLSNVLPKEDGFLGWFGQVIDTYQKLDITFSLHRYPPLVAPSSKPWEGFDWLPKAMDYLKGKGFGVWLGEFGGLSSFSDGENREFVERCINAAQARAIPFNLWSFYNDHGCYSGLYTDVLGGANLEPTRPVTLTSTVGGSTNPIEGGYNLAVGKHVFTANPEEGYRFKHWVKTSLDATQEEPWVAIIGSNPATIEIYEANVWVELQAVFEEEKTKTVAARMLPIPLLLVKLCKLRNAVVSEEVHKKIHPII